jgi:hypothetical protein
MKETATVARKSGDQEPAQRPVVDPELADELLARAEAGGVELLGPDCLLSQVTKSVLERALAEEMTGHLGYEKHDPAGRGSGNSRNGTTGKTVLTDIGAVDLAVPRDRAGSFEPQIVRKGQTRRQGFNERIIALFTWPSGSTARATSRSWACGAGPRLGSRRSSGCRCCQRSGPGAWPMCALCAATG